MARKVIRVREEEAPREEHYPVRMEDLAGHGQVVKVLLRALERGALAPSILITGPGGVGKGTLARMIAAALLCEAPTPSACGSCLPCRKMAKGIHPDFRTITLGVADSGKLRTQIIIEDVRDQILAPLALPPYEGKRLIFLVDPANALNETCQNVLLKPLEEPPRYAQFILVTSSPWKLLPTIHSRCQRLGLAPLSREEMAPWVEASSIETGEARGLALAWAAGRPGRVSDFDPGAFRKRRRDLLDLVELGMDASKAQGLFRATERLAKENPSEILRDVSALLADAARSMEGLPPRFHSDAAAELERAAIARGREGLRKLADKLAEAPVYLNHNSNPRLLLEWVFLAP